MIDTFDVIVIGGGAIGLATAYNLAGNKAKTLVLERFTFLNELGSSAGVSRQFRIPYPEPYMVEMALKATPLWDALQEETDKPLREFVGTLWFGDPTVHSTEGNIGAAETALQAKKVKFTTLKARDIEERFNFRDLPSTYVGLFQPNGASIDLKATIETLLQASQASPHVTLKEDSRVVGIRQRGKTFEVSTRHGTYTCEKLVLTPGPYIDEVVRLLGFETKLIYWNMSSCYFKKTDPNVTYPTWFVFQNPVHTNGNQFYGFPEVSWDRPGYIRTAPDFVMKPLTEPSQRTSVPNVDELRYTSEWVRRHMRGLDPKPHFATTCFVALSEEQNKELIIDFAPPYVHNHTNIVIYATGWAGKFVPLIGRILSDLTLHGRTDYDISEFRMGDKIFAPL
ncbi:MAG TPA: FAD-dependent oxidoreductase [Allosphingosinicella sp.]|jgi:glycine/D-amino acid oxidase-like deaminating enzyme